MNNTLKILAIVVLSLVVVGAVLGAGFLVGQAVTARQTILAGAGPVGAYGLDGRPGMMQGWDQRQAPSYGPGMQPGWGMDRGRRPGMMDDFGRMPMFGGGPAAANVEPLTVEATTEAVQTFLDELGKDNLALGEIMIFDNHAYAVIEDTTTGQGAFEVLVDPVRQVVHLEFGPSMMWNTTYGMHGSDPINPRGMMGGRSMMGGPGYVGPVTVPDNNTPLTEAEAREKAVAYLEQAYPEQTVSATAEAFPGYFTFDVETDGTPVSMLSVNAATGQIWYHTWHGTFIEMSE